MTEVRSQRSAVSDSRSRGGKLMKKKVIGLALGALLFAPCLSADAQQTGKNPAHRLPG